MENANCLNTLGSYTCVCSSGYTGDGFSSCDENKQGKEVLFIGIGVVVAGLALIAIAVIIILLACRLKRSRVNMAKNTAYLSKSRATLSKSSTASTAASGQGSNIHTKPNEAYTLLTATNEAYNIMEREITTFTNDAYATTDVHTFPNRAYPPGEYSGDTNTLTYNYPYCVYHST